MPKVDPTVCSAAILIYCKESRQSCKATVAERSNMADNYRAEILGGILTQLLLHAASPSPITGYIQQTICCDNRGVVGHVNSASTGLKSKQPQADTLRTLKQLILTAKYNTTYVWVPAHQDDTKRQEELTLRERMNVVVDSLAKQALRASVSGNDFITNDFPLETVRILVGGTKVTGDALQKISEHWGKGVARELFHNRNIIDWTHFDKAWWGGPRSVMKELPRMFQVFVTKQTSRFCGTNRQLSRYDPSVLNKCPSCGQNDEPSGHITRCPNPGRRQDTLCRRNKRPAGAHGHRYPSRYMITEYL